MKLKLLTCLLYVFVIVSTSAQSREKSHRIFGSEEGLSGLSVFSILEDSKGFIWIGTQYGLNKFDGYSFTHYKRKAGDSTSISSNVILSLAEDRVGDIWIGTYEAGVCKFNTRTETFERFQFNGNASSGIRDNNIRALHIDSKNRIRVGHSKGADIFDPSTGRFTKIPLSGDDLAVSHITEDTRQNIWYNLPNRGLFFQDIKLGSTKLQYPGNYKDFISDSDDNLLALSEKEGLKRFSPYKTRGKGFGPLYEDLVNNVFYFFGYDSNFGKLYFYNSNSELAVYDDNNGTTERVFSCDYFKERYLINTVIQDKVGSYWIGTETNGLIYVGANSKPFHLDTFGATSSDGRDDFPRTVYELFQDSKGYLWTEDVDYSAVQIDPRNGEKKKFPKLDAFLSSDVPGIMISNFIEDHDGGIWILGYSFAPIRLNSEDGLYVKHEDFKKEFNQKLPYKNFTHGLQTRDGLIWLGSVSGSLIAYDPRTKAIEKRFSYSTLPGKKAVNLPSEHVLVIFEDLSDNLLIGFTDGLYQLDRGTEIFTKISYLPKNKFNKGEARILSIHQSKKDVIWIGTEEGLFCYDRQDGKTTSYGTNEGLPDLCINDILEDNQGYLWLITNYGISRLDRSSGTFRNYDAADGLNQLGFCEANLISKFDGNIYLGGSKGYNVFDPKEIRDNPHIPEIVITSFKTNHKEQGFVSVPGINSLERIRLSNLEKDFTVEFAALDYTNPSKNQYAYQLEGYNENWIKIGAKRDITFTSLEPGEYVLRVKGSNDDGLWNHTGKSLVIEIMPPWWGTWWAYSFYGLAILALAYWVYHYRNQKLHTKRLVELDKVKRTMYTNITHEFRTPITIISGINQELREHFQGEREDHFDLIHKNSENLLYLVNQMLELRKMEVGKIIPEYIQDDIMSYLRYIQQSFDSYAKTKNITIHYISSIDELVMDYDPDKLLMIMSNLLSNALKYSNPGGNIYLQVDKMIGKLQIKVTDTGIGIPSKELPHIFDRFYKVTEKGSDNMDGVGIGLALTKDLVEILNGEIYAKSSVGKGSVFTLLLPILHSAEHSDSIDFTPSKLPYIGFFRREQKDVVQKLPPEPSDSKPTLLLIEDNEDIITYLIKCLQDIWNIHLARDGREGVDKIIEIVPDIVLCDLMMPKLDGFGVLDIVKNDEKSSHIPVVMLTAKADKTSRIKAYKKGADSFLVKPFNKNELLVVLEKLVEQRKVLHARYRPLDSFTTKFETKLHKEDEFILKLEKIVLSDQISPMDGVEALCRSLAMSRTQLHNKVKALTGMSTSNYVRTIRLKKAKHLLVHTDKAISEIAYEVGFNHPSYFTKSFTNEFGLPPSSLRK